MKVVLIGGGSYVFAPTVIGDLIVKARFSGLELVLVDINKEAAQLMADVATRIAQTENVSVTVHATDDRVSALPGADFVITSVAYEGAKRWLTDFDICQQEGIPDELRETGALSGIVYGFRTITLMMGIVRDMERLCPNAILLNVSNPLTKVQTAVSHYATITTYGFCSVAQCGPVGYDKVAYLLKRDHTTLDVESAGINHLAWITAVRDKETGKDLLPSLIDALQAGNSREDRILRRWYDEFGAMAAPPSEHAGEFMPFQPDVSYYHKPPFHGDAAERQARITMLRAIASGTLDYRTDPHFLNVSWEHPGLFAAILVRKETGSVNTLNVVNDGCLPQLPNNAVVEVPVTLRDGAVVPRKGIFLPEAAAELCRNQLIVSEMVAQAAIEGDRKLAMDIIDVDRSISQKTAARNALTRMLAAHQDILPQFA